MTTKAQRKVIRKRYYEKNKKRLNEEHMQYYEENKEAILAQRKAYMKKYNAKPSSKAKRADYQRQYVKDNYEKVKAQQKEKEQSTKGNTK